MSSGPTDPTTPLLSAPVFSTKNGSVELQLDEGSVRSDRRVDHFLVVVARHSLVQRLNLRPSDVKLDVVSGRRFELQLFCVVFRNEYICS